MDLSPKMFLICCPLAALAGFIEAIAGGGGLLTLPGYLLAGLPAHLAYGTNKFSAAFGTFTAMNQYRRSGDILWRLVPVGAASALVGSLCGARLALVLSDRALRIFMMIALPAVALFLLAKRDFGREETTEKPLTRAQTLLRLFAVGFGIGLYDGFFGPGAGTFYILGFSLLFGVSLLKAAGTSKAINLASNMAALFTFVLSGNVLYGLAIPCALCSMLGNFLGAHMAVRVGAPLIRKIMSVVLILLLAKIAVDFFR